MTNINKLIPVLVSSDMEASIKFYKSLGFALLYGDEDYVSLSWAQHEIHISPMLTLQKHEQALVAGWTSLRLNVENIERLYNNLVNRDIINSAETVLVERDYGMLEFSLLDPSGIALTFYKDVS